LTCNYLYLETYSGNHDIDLKVNRSIRFKELFEKANYNLLITEEHAQKTFMKGKLIYSLN